MPIDYGHARGWVGRVVMMRRGEEVSLDRLIGKQDTGMLLLFQRTGTLPPERIDELRPVAPHEAAQIIVDLNAAAGNEHDAATLTPSAGILCALFPDTFAGGEAEALKLLMTRTPSDSGADV